MPILVALSLALAVGLIAFAATAGLGGSLLVAALVAVLAAALALRRAFHRSRLEATAASGAPGVQHALG